MKIRFATDIPPHNLSEVIDGTIYRIKSPNCRLETIMETLSLWYNMEVFYTNEQVKDLHFTGIVKRYEDIGVILNALEKSVHVKFERKGNVLIIN